MGTAVRGVGGEEQRSAAFVSTVSAEDRLCLEGLLGPPTGIRVDRPRIVPRKERPQGFGPRRREGGGKAQGVCSNLM